MLRRVALVRTDVSEERVEPIIRVTCNQNTLQRNNYVKRYLRLDL
jgi:hypothetical protein